MNYSLVDFLSKKISVFITQEILDLKQNQVGCPLRTLFLDYSIEKYSVNSRGGK